MPAFDAPPTDHGGLTGSLSLPGHDDAILVARLLPQSVYTGEYDKLRRETPHRALVIACTGTRPGIGLLNAERFRHRQSMCRPRRVPPSLPVPHAPRLPGLSRKADVLQRSLAMWSARFVVPDAPLRQWS